MSIEVKSGRRKPNLKGMAVFSKCLNVANKISVGEEGVALEEFLSVPAEQWL